MGAGVRAGGAGRGEALQSPGVPEADLRGEPLAREPSSWCHAPTL